ncbi:MAG: trypsin-like peptidase domain-containing protein [Desulfovibrionales bacterium]
MRWTPLLLALWVCCLLFPLRTGNAQEDLRRTPVVRAVQAVAPSVVNIQTRKVVERSNDPFGQFFSRRDDVFSPFLREFFGPGTSRRHIQQSLGSGVIIDREQSFVLTNAHVIAGASEISVRLLDGREFPAELVGSDPDFDLALLRLESGQPLPHVELGDSDGLLIGETVIAIGNPFGFSHTVTTGVVSATSRTIETKHGLFTDFIQTDAAINPGNSGGPLLDITGRLVGINTAIFAEAQGIGFAIPINKAKRVIDELVSHGRVQPVWLGVSGQDVDQRIASYLGLPAVSGMLVNEVFPSTPARDAGIRPGDVIQTVNGYSIKDKTHYLDILRNYTRGREVELGILRQGEHVAISIRPQSLTADIARQLAADRWGLQVQDSGPGRGLAIVSVRPGGPAAVLGIQEGDRLINVAGMDLATVDDFVSAFSRNRMHSSVIVLVARGGRGFYLRLTV